MTDNFPTDNHGCADFLAARAQVCEPCAWFLARVRGCRGDVAACELCAPSPALARIGLGACDARRELVAHGLPADCIDMAAVAVWHLLKAHKALQETRALAARNAREAEAGARLAEKLALMGSKDSAQFLEYARHLRNLQGGMIGMAARYRTPRRHYRGRRRETLKRGLAAELESMIRQHVKRRSGRGPDVSAAGREALREHAATLWAAVVAYDGADPLSAFRFHLRRR